MDLTQLAVINHSLEEHHCGDRAGFWEYNGKIVLCMIDGLGHGRGAERAALMALGFVERHHREPLLEVFAMCDRVLRDTRGVAMGISVIDMSADTLQYAGIGNTRSIIVGEKSNRLSSHYGIVGGGYRTLRTETVSLVSGDTLLMYTDGIEELVDFSDYNESVLADSQCLARRVFEDFRLESDDATVLVYRFEK